MSISEAVKSKSLQPFELDIVEYINENKNKEGLFIVSTVSIAKSGASRKMRIGIVRDGEFTDITSLVADLLGYKIDSKDGRSVVVKGGGMDMRFAVLSSLMKTITDDSRECYLYRSVNTPISF